MAVAVQGRDRGGFEPNQRNGGANHGTCYQCVLQHHEIERLREKARHDEAQALSHAEQQGMQKGLQQGLQQGALKIARNLIETGMPLQQISAVTGLTQGEIENLFTVS